MSQPHHLKAVVFDWAGTMVDHGSLAPMGVFVASSPHKISVGCATRGQNRLTLWSRLPLMNEKMTQRAFSTRRLSS